MVHTGILKPMALHTTSLKGQSCSTNFVQLVAHQISLTKSQCSKQKLNLMCNISHLKFPSLQKVSMTKTKLFSVISVNFGFMLNVTTLIIQITGIFKTVVNPGIAQNVTAQFSLSTLLSSNKNFLACCTNTYSDITQWEDLENDHNSSLSLKPSNLELLLNQFNNATPENSNNLEKSSSSKFYDIEEIHNIKIPQK